MKSDSCKITITVEEDIAKWLRTEAARSNTSASGFVSRILKQRRIEDANYEAAKNRAVARKPFLKSDGPYLTREEAHDRSR